LTKSKGPGKNVEGRRGGKEKVTLEAFSPLNPKKKRKKELLGLLIYCSLEGTITVEEGRGGLNS